MTENEIAREIVDAAFKIHVAYGSGLLESAYSALMVHVLTRRGLRVEAEKSIPLHYEGVVLATAFRADMVVEGKVIIELKSIVKVQDVHKKQLLTYLRISGLKLGLLINFGELLIGDGITRIINGKLD